jgi:peptidoglycan-associated lipoprotein
MQKSLVIALPFALLAACSSAPPAVNAPVAAASSGADGMQAAQPRQISAGAKPVLSELDDPASILARRSVYFPYDNFRVDANYEQMLNAHASYLKHNPASRITLQGSTDERGSREYNLALGQKRAEAVRNSLNLRGVPDMQMEAVSFGKERPKATCHEERCWRENRRTDIAYPANH